MNQDGARGRAALLALHDLLAAADRAIEANDHGAARNLLERAGATLHTSGPEASGQPPGKREGPMALRGLRALLDAVAQSVEIGDLAEASELLDVLRDAVRASRPPSPAEPKASPRRVSGFRFVGRRKDVK
jgi:hypothetical protein